MGVALVLMVHTCLIGPAYAEDAPPLVVQSTGEGDHVPAEADVLGAIAAELGRAVVASGDARGAVGESVQVVFELRPAKIVVNYQKADGSRLERAIERPEDLHAAVAAAALLVGNVVRDQAAEILATAPAPAAPPPPPVVPPAPQPEAPYTPATASFFYPAATNYASPDVRTGLSFNVLYGRVGQVDGVQIGGLVNHVGGDVRGLQIAGLINVNRGSLVGLELSLVGNTVRKEVHGAQVGGLYNTAGGDLEGFQVASVFNRVSGRADGVQVALVNVAGDVSGGQIGFLNIAKKVRGMQVGFLNIAEDIEGMPLGFISVTESGGIHPVVWSGQVSYVNLGLKFSTRYTYTLLFVSGHEMSVGRHGDTRLYGPGLAWGGRLPLNRLVFESDLGASWLFGGQFCCLSKQESLSDDVVLFRWRALVNYEILSHLGVFAGVGLTMPMHFYPDEDHDVSLDMRPEVFGGISL
jgi:hypothetical protein